MDKKRMEVVERVVSSLVVGMASLKTEETMPALCMVLDQAALNLDVSTIELVDMLQDRKLLFDEVKMR